MGYTIVKMTIRGASKILLDIVCMLTDMLYVVNSKKPPYLCGKYAKPPLFREIAKNHRFCENSLQYAFLTSGPIVRLTWHTKLVKGRDIT
jgi:hypothetical protein